MRRAVSWWHRWLGLVLVAPLLVWATTGLLFHLKPGWSAAYDMLSVVRDAPLDGALATPQQLAMTAGAAVTRIDYLSTALGPVARVTHGDGSSLHDAGSGRVISPVSEADGEKLVADAVARSPHRARYGAPGKGVAAAGELTFRTAGGVTLTLNRNTLSLSQRGGDTERIDWLYELHYLRWTGVRTVDRVLGIAGIVAIWTLAALGVILAVRRR